MGTISDKLTYLQGTKTAIHDAIVAKGVNVPVGTTFRNYATKISEITTGNPLPQADPYMRPAEWLTLPDNVNGVEKVSILKAIFNTDSEFIAFTCNGNYTVDWGDGVVENFNADVKAEHKYDYSNANLNSATVTKFGYKQCIITITPQAGQNLITCRLNQFHTTIGSSASYNMNSGFLDININLPNVIGGSNFGIGTATLTGTGSYVNMSSLERVSIGQMGLTTFSYLFYNCYSVQEVLFGFDTSVVTNWSNTFYNCYSLQKSPTIVFNPSGVSVLTNMYQNCYSLVEIQDINVILLSNAAGGMFNSCTSLTRLVLNITSSTNISFASMFATCYSLSDLTLTLSGGGRVTSLSSTFSNCYSLTEAPMLDTGMCSTFQSTFQGTGLIIAPDYNYLSATTLSSCYVSCKSLIYVPDITISSSCTNLSSLFNTCNALTIAPNITGGTAVTNISSMFTACTSLVSVPTYSFPAITTSGVNNLFNGCVSLKEIPAMNIGSAYTSNTTIISGAFALCKMLLPLKYTFTVANAKMSANALNEMFGILPTVTGQTVTITGNYGASTCDTSIATAKGWTVTN